MKRMQRVTICLLLAGLCLVGTVSCARQDGEERHAVVTYDTDRIGEYVRMERYTEWNIPMASEDSLRGEAVWDFLLDRAEFLRLPEEQRSYYEEQSRSAVRHYAEENQLDYEDALAQLGTSEERIAAEAEHMVKADLLYYYIVQHARIEVTPQEKEALSARYVKKFAEDYGYDEEYVKEEMQSLIDDAMLYDKTTEYLILHNTFTVEEQTDRS